MQQNEITAVLSPNADNELDINQRQISTSVTLTQPFNHNRPAKPLGNLKK